MKRFGNPRIWDYIAINARNSIEAGGWYNSFDGEAYSQAEMDQYVKNTYEKLKTYLGKKKTVIEIGCASGVTMFHIAHFVGKYIGTDMAKANLERNAKKIQREGIRNIELCQCCADEINTVLSGKVDMVIINSVCQYFPDMKYFENVLWKSLGLLNDGGVLYLGDLLDLDLLGKFKAELTIYQAEHQDKKVNIDRTDELWISRTYFNEMSRSDRVKEIIISDKLAVIENELTKYRYDVVILV